jgi:hypothetical protein
MKIDDKDKLDECLRILDTTDLGLSMVWLWTWSTIMNFYEDESWKTKASKDEMWEHLVTAVAEGRGFSLEYGAEQHYEDVVDWMQENGWLVDSMFEDDEDDEEEDNGDE